MRSQLFSVGDTVAFRTGSLQGVVTKVTRNADPTAKDGPACRQLVQVDWENGQSGRAANQSLILIEETV